MTRQADASSVQDMGTGALLAEQHRLREASYQLADGRSVWYDNGDAVTDAAHLWAVLEELHGTGSPNVENMQAKHILDRLQQGGGLGEFHVGTLRKLLAKHADAIEQFRRSPEGQDLMDVATGGPEARIIDAKESTNMNDDDLEAVTGMLTRARLSTSPDEKRRHVGRAIARLRAQTAAKLEVACSSASASIPTSALRSANRLQHPSDYGLPNQRKRTSRKRPSRMRPGSDGTTPARMAICSRAQSARTPASTWISDEQHDVRDHTAQPVPEPVKLQRSYRNVPHREHRIAGDQRLLVELERRCQPRRTDRGRGYVEVDAAGLTVGQLPEAELRAIVEEVEGHTDHYGRWRLAGEADQPILERLDQHFADVQTEWFEERAENAERQARSPNDQAEFRSAARRSERRRIPASLEPSGGLTRDKASARSWLAGFSRAEPGRG